MALMALNNTINGLRDEATRIQSEFVSEIDELNRNTRLSMSAKREEFAKLRLQSEEALARLKEREAAEVERTRQSLARQISGTATGSASDVISFRDARDRAALVDTAAEAREMMSHAIDHGDTVLAHALLERSVRHAFSGAVDVYTAAQPAMSETIRDLYDVYRWTDDTHATFNTIFAYQLPTPRLREMFEGIAANGTPVY